MCIRDRSEKVDHKKVTFVNRYGITLAADLYKPKNASGKYLSLIHIFQIHPVSYMIYP